MTLNTVIIDTPRATLNKGGAFYLSSSTLTTTMNFNYVSFKVASAGQSGGVIYLTGLHASLTATSLKVSTAEATGGDGGVFHFDNVGTTSVTLTTPVFTSI